MSLFDEYYSEYTEYTKQIGEGTAELLNANPFSNDAHEAPCKAIEEALQAASDVVKQASIETTLLFQVDFLAFCAPAAQRPQLGIMVDPAREVIVFLTEAVGFWLVFCHSLNVPAPHFFFHMMLRLMRVLRFLLCRWRYTEGG